MVRVARLRTSWTLAPCVFILMRARAARLRRMLEAQVLVLSHVEKQERFTVFDFGFPSSAHEEQLVYTGNLPSIKGKCEKKAPSSPEQRATMHDIPARRW